LGILFLTNTIDTSNINAKSGTITSNDNSGTEAVGDTVGVEVGVGLGVGVWGCGTTLKSIESLLFWETGYVEEPKTPPSNKRTKQDAETSICCSPKGYL
jgi:hypothetical protein